MIKFKAKNFSEYDAMRSLYVELMRNSDKGRFGIIDSSALIPILRGNNVVIERFVISTSFLGRDRYRMYLKIGAKAKLPDEVRLPEKVYDKKLGNAQININGSIFPPKNDGGYNNNRSNNNTPAKLDNTDEPKSTYKGGSGTRKDKKFSAVHDSVLQKLFADKKKEYPYIGTQISPYVDLSYEVRELLGDAVKYDKKARSLVLEFASIGDAIRALNILPFGLGYKIYLLNA